MACAAEIPNITNTVDYSGVTAYMDYYDKSGTFCTITTSVKSDGYFSFKRPANYSRFSSCGFLLSPTAQPPAGNYDFELTVYKNSGGSDGFSHGDVMYMNTYKNANLTYAGGGVGLRQNLSAVYLHGSLQSTNSSYLYFRFFNLPNFTFYPEWSGLVKISFTRMKPESKPQVSNSYSSSQDTQNQISSSVQNISSAMDDVNASLREIVQTISYQLQAFWNQLAGEFTNLYAKMNQQHLELINAIKNGLEVTIVQEFDELIRNDNWNHNDQLANDNRNTETITNGYDNSGMSSDNDRLSDSLDEYQTAEDEVLSGVKDNIRNFNYDNPFTALTNPLSDLSYWLAEIYRNLGSYNVPIAFNFTLSIALIMIGYYRFKGGA